MKYLDHPVFSRLSRCSMGCGCGVFARSPCFFSRFRRKISPPSVGVARPSFWFAYLSQSPLLDGGLRKLGLEFLERALRRQREIMRRVTPRMPRIPMTAPRIIGARRLACVKETELLLLDDEVAVIGVVVAVPVRVGADATVPVAVAVGETVEMPLVVGDWKFCCCRDKTDQVLLVILRTWRSLGLSPFPPETTAILVMGSKAME